MPKYMEPRVLIDECSLETLSDPLLVGLYGKGLPFSR